MKFLYLDLEIEHFRKINHFEKVLFAPDKKPLPQTI